MLFDEGDPRLLCERSNARHRLVYFPFIENRRSPASALGRKQPLVEVSYRPQMDSRSSSLTDRVRRALLAKPHIIDGQLLEEGSEILSREFWIIVRGHLRLVALAFACDALVN